MRKNTKAGVICLTIVLFLGSVGVSWSADYQKAIAAFKNGDWATALREWTPLAEQGNANAQTFLGLMYHKGEGVLEDYKAAAKWYSLAAEQGNAIAQYHLSLMYHKGEGVPQDYKTAVKWCSLAAEQGMADAQNNLGYMYLNGYGVLQDYVYAHMWFNISASSGYKDAFKNRDLVEERMPPVDIATAQNLARECVRKGYKGC